MREGPTRRTTRATPGFKATEATLQPATTAGPPVTMPKGRYELLGNPTVASPEPTTKNFVDTPEGKILGFANGGWLDAFKGKATRGYPPAIRRRVD